ncbi:peptidylprolyl isomerase [Shewanella schlegeliana]|uniref:Peptidyl-prolyl cis-trans isomerase n=1 Tax=Shewanella schlegeliana TaxID=190308 RepID=A0ABS1SUE2_9GAMM|nr:peptidylprolyl isomerase [Shewanella schlegeliana]MBL4912153.1 peptidylprolyl isomerase [Shewanella schlegeliana]MCL1110761.1 peptidylprolyl isomerase [Shewanella schlegeliana]GIU22825.1 peptidyl-prolyl cis-trans isomerase [Shewanella schlegeliana]
MKITEKCAVSIHYRLSDAKGQLVESSFEGEPMIYLHGAENMIPGLEAALEGKAQGDILDVTVDAEQGYGPYHDGLRQEVPLSAFGDIEDIVPGMRFIAETEMGQRPVQVTEVKDDVVVVDGNHPLAGQSLVFNVEVLEVRAATEEEIAHGHIHAHGGGCGGHGHSHEGGCCGGDHDHGHEGGCCSDDETKEAKEGCDGNGGCGCRH